MTSLVLLGAGNAGLAFALAARDAGIDIRGIWNRGEPRRARAETLLPGAAVHEFDTPLTDADILLVGLSDSAIATITSRVQSFTGVVMHLSGALPAAIFQRPRVASMHPLLAIADPERGAHDMRTATFAIEGVAEDEARALVEAIGATAISIQGLDKALYHAAAVLASNLVVATIAAAQDLVPEALRPALVTMARSSLANVAATNVVEALTGPVRRGDISTIRAHLAALPPGPTRDLYRSASLRALDLARARGLSDAQAADIQLILA